MIKTNKKEAIAQYEKAYQAVEELKAAIQNEGTISDCETFNDIAKSNPFADVMIKRLTSVERHEQFADTVKQLNRERDTEVFCNRLKKDIRQKRNQRVRLTAIFVSSCAALLICSLWIWKHPQPDPLREKVVVTNQISQDITEPTIILANGECVPLRYLESNTQPNVDMIIEQSGNLKLTHSLPLDSTGGEIKYNTLVMPVKNKRTIVLGDGTEVCLNAGSKLIYPVGAHSSMREVQLEGEAFFHVTKSEKPFIVRMGTSTVKVYGTMFNLRSLKDEIETILVEGQVGFSGENRKEIMMMPNQKLSYNIKSGQSHVETVVVEDYTLWMNNLFSFKDQTLRRVLYDISSWYGITITTRPELMDRELTLVQSRNDAPDDILKFISEILNCNFIVEGKEGYSIE